MSHPKLCGRETPRWSVATGLLFVSVQAAVGIASTAGLVESSAKVWVAPPFDCRPLGSSPAPILFRSPVAFRKAVQESSDDRLYPLETNGFVAKQLCP